MTTEEQEKLNEHIKGIAEILFNNTPAENLKSFESIELAVREHMLTTVSPVIGSFFLRPPQAQKPEGIET